MFYSLLPTLLGCSIKTGVLILLLPIQSHVQWNLAIAQYTLGTASDVLIKTRGFSGTYFSDTLGTALKVGVLISAHLKCPKCPTLNSSTVLHNGVYSFYLQTHFSTF